MFATNSANVDVVRRVPSCVCSQRVQVMETLSAGFTTMWTAGSPMTTWSRRLVFRLQTRRRRPVPLCLPLSRAGRPTDARLKVPSRKIRREFRVAFHMGVVAGVLAVANHTDAGCRMQGVVLLDSRVAGSLLCLMVFDSQFRVARCGRN